MSKELEPYKGKSGRGVKKAEPLETGDMTAILDLTIKSSIKRSGHTAYYPADKEGYDNFVNRTIDYFEYLNTVNSDPNLERKLIPDIENWAVYMGVTRATIFNYERRGGEWADMIAYFKNAIAAVKKQLALNYKIPPMVAIFDLTNNHSYVNTSEFKLTTPETETRPRQSALEDEIRAAGLVWDEEKAEFVPLKRNDLNICSNLNKSSPRGNEHDTGTRT